MAARILLVPATLTALVLAGCSPATTAGSPQAAAVGAGAEATEPAGDTSPGATEAAQAASPSEVDACSLLTATEIQEVIDTNSGPRGHGGHCEWVNTDNQHSVTVDIGDSGTAVDGQLPAPIPGAETEDGPDGIRYSSGNVAEFLIGDRACQIQVVTSVSDDSDRPTAVRLIGLIKQRVTP